MSWNKLCQKDKDIDSNSRLEYITKEEVCMTGKNKLVGKELVQEIIAKRIEQLCKEREITYYTLSYKSTIPLTTLIHIMEGSTKNPGIFTIMKICDGLGVSMKEFFDTREFDEVMSEYD